MRWHRSICHLALVAAVCAVAGTAAGQLPNPMLLGLRPSGGRAGENLAVTIRGENLDAAQTITFSHPGIKGTLSLSSTSTPVWRRPAADATFDVTIAGNVPPGRYEVRVGGRFGLSTSFPFFVDELQVVQEKDGNQSPETATPIEPDTIVDGELAGTNVDHFRFQGEPGQRFVVVCATRPLHGRLNYVVQVAGPDGRLIGSAAATATREPVVPIVIRDAGVHVIRVHDRAFQGAASFSGERYRLTLSTQPYVAALWPSVRTTTASGTHRLLGHLLPGGRSLAEGGLEEVEVVVPAAAASSRRSGADYPLALLASFGVNAATYRPNMPAGASSPLAVAVAAAPPLLDTEPNGRESAQRISLPADVAGRFDGPDDVDWFSFDARQGDRVAVEVQAERLGGAIDVAVVVEQVDRDPQGAETVRIVAEQDDPPTLFSHPPCNFETTDPRLVFTADRDGTYRIGVRNASGGSYADAAAIYRLLVRPAAADFRVLAAVGALGQIPNEFVDTTLSVPTTPRLRRGGCVPIVVQVHRLDGFDGPVTVGVDGLPPGVTCAPVTLAAGVNQAAVVLAAADNAAAWRGSIRISGKARVGDQDRTRQVEWAAVAFPRKREEKPVGRLVDEMPLEVVAEPAPLRIAATQAAVGPVPRGGSVKIPFAVETALEMLGPVRVEVRELPSAKPGPPYPKTPVKVLDAGQRAGEIEISIPADAPVGEHVIHLVTQVSLKVARDPEAAAAAAKVQQEFAARKVPLQETADTSLKALEAAKELVKAVAKLPNGPEKTEAVADAEAVRKAADQATSKAKAKLDAHVREETPLKQWSDRIQKENEPKPTDGFAASPPIRLTITAPDPPAEKKTAGNKLLRPLLPLLVQAATSLTVSEDPDRAETPAKPEEGGEAGVRGTGGQHGAIDFGRDVLPILRANCIACHAAAQPEAGIVLDSPEAMLRPREDGPALVPGKAAESLIYRLAAHELEPVMPPDDNDRGARRLSAAELAILRGWIDAGAKAGTGGPRPIAWQAFPAGIRSIYATAVSPDGTLVAAGIADRITVFDVATRKPVARLVDGELPVAAGGGRRTAAHLGAVRSLAFSPDGKRLASGAMRAVTIWSRSDDVSGGGTAWRPERRIGSVEQADPFVGRVTAVAFSPDGTLIAAGGGEPTVSGEVVLVAADTAVVVRRIPLPHGDPVGCVAFSPDGKWLATGANRVVGVCDVATGQLVQAFDEHGSRVLGVAWKGDGSALVSVGADATACVWKTDPWEKIESMKLSGREAVGVRFRGATDAFVVAEGDGRIRIRGVGLSGPQPEFGGRVEGVQCLSADAAGDVVAAGGVDGTLRVWAATGGEPVLLADPDQ